MEFRNNCFLKEIIIFCSIIFFSCNNQNPNASIGGKQNKITPKESRQDRFYLTVNNETTTDFEVDEKKLENINNLDAGLIYENVKDTGDGYLVKITYDKFKINLKTGDNEQELNTENAGSSINPVEKMLGLLKGSSISMLIDKQGKAINVSGNKELVDKILNAVNAVTPSEKEKMRNELMGMLGDNFIKNNLLQSLNIWPDSVVKVGGKWAKNYTEESNGIKMDMDVNYRFISAAGDIAEINSSANIPETGGALDLGTPGAQQASVKLSGNQEGTYHCNINTGMLKDCSTKLLMKGAISTALRDVPISIKVKKSITITRL